MIKTRNVITTLAFTLMFMFSNTIFMRCSASQTDVGINEHFTQVVGNWLATVRIDGLDIQIFRMPGDPTGMNVLYTAPWHFILEENGLVDVTIREIPFKSVENQRHTRQCTIKLAKNPVGTRYKIAALLNRHNIVPGITPANVNPAELYYVRVEDITPNMIKDYHFASFERYYPKSQLIFLDALVENQQDADTFKKWVEEGNARFIITQRLYAEAWVSDQSADGRIQVAKAVQSIIDASSSISDNDVRHSLKPRFVDKLQKAQIEEVLTASKDVLFRSMDVDTEDNKTFLSWIESLMTEMFQEIKVDFKAERDWDIIRDYLNSKGVKESVINSFENENKDLLQTSESNSVSVKASGAAKFLWLSANMSANIDTSSSKEYLSEKYKKEIVDGQITIPTALNLYEISEGAYEKIMSWSARQLKTTHTLKESREDVSTEAPGCWEVNVVHLERYASADFSALQKQLTLAQSQADALPAQPQRLNEQSFSIAEGDLRAGKRLEILRIPKWGEGDSVDRAATYLCTIFMNNEGGDNVICQLIFQWGSTKEVKPVAGNAGLVKFMIVGDLLYAMLKGPDDY